MSDLEVLSSRIADEELCIELYRALTRNTWTKPGIEGHLSLSFQRAATLVNALRNSHGGEPLELNQSGREGEVSPLVADELGRRGWTHRPLNTSRHDDAHLSKPESAPPKGTGARRIGADGRWESEAHAEAEAERRRRQSD